MFSVMRWRLVSLECVLLLAVACGGQSWSDWECESPPEGERDAASALPLAVTPNPVAAGAMATLHVGLPDPRPAGTDIGGPPSLAWQCWNGVEWVDTHQITRDGITRFVPPGETTTSLGSLSLFPGDFTIEIPEVPPGWYRIRDLVYLDGGVNGYLMVEVVAADR